MATTTTKKVKKRKVEELIEAATKDMTPEEKTILIKYLKEKIIVADNKLNQLEQNLEQAYKQAREAEKTLNEIQVLYKNRFEFISESSKRFCQAICLATKGELY